MSRQTTFGTGSLGTDATALYNSCTAVERGMLLALAGTDAAALYIHALVVRGGALIHTYGDCLQQAH